MAEGSSELQLGEAILSAGVFGAEILAGTVGEALKTAGGPLAPPEQHYYFPGVFKPAELAALPLPIDPNRRPNRRIVLATETGFERFTSDEEAAGAYAENPRTMMYEDSAYGDTGWQGKTVRYLMEILRYQISFSFFDSVVGDGGFGPHTDDWHTTVVHFSDEKAWWLGPDANNGDNSEPTVILAPPGPMPHNR